MAADALLSLIVPTRNRPDLLRAFLTSVADTADRPGSVEVVLVIDADDLASQEVGGDRLALKRVLVLPGLTMGALNQAGYEASSGRYLMLLNDDVTARTPGWDTRLRGCFQGCPDDILLVHVNDHVFQQALCTFPVVSRTFCELAGGICPRDYARYRIDDHIEDVFNLLGLLGDRRTVYLPDVVFEHANYRHRRDGLRQYFSDEGVLAADAPRFDALAPARKELALRLKKHIEDRAAREREAGWRLCLDAAGEASALRVPERLRVLTETGGAGRVAVGILTADGSGEEVRACLDALRARTRHFDLTVVDGQRSADFRPAREMNRLLQTSAADYFVFLEDDVIVSPGWLDGLLGSLSENVGLVSPLHTTGEGRLAWGGLAFHPDGSGHHGHLQATPGGPRFALSVCGPCLLVDRTRCRHLLFDEAYGSYFHEIDYGLRLWEAGHEVAVSPAVTVTHLRPGPRPYGNALLPEAFEKDRQRFAARWLGNGRMRNLETQVWARYPELRDLLNLGAAADDLLTHRTGESLADFDTRARRVLAGISAIPIVRHALIQRALALLGGQPPEVRDPRTGPLAWLLGRCGRAVPVEANYLGHRLDLCERFYATPAGEGGFDPERYRRGGYRAVYAAGSLEVLRERIRAGLLEPLANPAGTTVASRLAYVAAARARKVRECVRQVGYRGLARIAWHRAHSRLARLWRRGEAAPNLSNPTAAARPLV